MKKLLIASTIAMTIASGSAMAADTAAPVQTGTVEFVGVVTTGTCDILVSVGDKETNIIDLGTVVKGQRGTPVSFALKAKDASNCVLSDNGAAEVLWTGDLGLNGLVNSKGSAQAATAYLQAMNTKNGDQLITSNNSTVVFDANEVVNEGLKFQATLDSSVRGTAGTFSSTGVYAVAYP